MATFTRKELDASTYLNDEIRPMVIDAISKKSMFFNPIKRDVTKFVDKNKDILQTNIIGKQLILNKKTEESILSAFKIKEKDVKDIIKKSEYFKKFSNLKLTDQLVFAIPLLLASGEFYKMKKMNESKFFYLLAFYKPYASVIFKYFGKFPVNEDRMLYTVENLSERFDIKRQGSVQEFLEKKAESSYDNYIETLIKDVITDADLHQIFASGIQSRLNNSVQDIFREYQKNEGKYMPFEQSTYEGEGDSEGELLDRDIKSDSAAKTAILRRIMSDITRNPVDEKLLNFSTRIGFSRKVSEEVDVTKISLYKYSGAQFDMMKVAINEIMDRETRQMPEFFEGIISSFLTNINPTTKKKFTTADLKSPVFVSNAVKIFKSPNTRDKNLLKVRKMLKEFLRKHSASYVNRGMTVQRNMEKSFFIYCVLLIQKG